MGKWTFECDGKDMGLLGVCLGSLGALAGMVIPGKYKNAAAFVCGGGFFLAGIALGVRTAAASREEFDEDWEDWEEEEDPGFVMRITAEE